MIPNYFVQQPHQLQSSLFGRERLVNRTLRDFPSFLLSFWDTLLHVSLLTPLYLYTCLWWILVCPIVWKRPEEPLVGSPQCIVVHNHNTAHDPIVWLLSQMSHPLIDAELSPRAMAIYMGNQANAMIFDPCWVLDMKTQFTPFLMLSSLQPMVCHLIPPIPQVISVIMLCCHSILNPLLHSFYLFLSY